MSGGGHRPIGSTDGAGAPLATISLTVGTAGHIDHGKSSLVAFLTGCEMDRHPEERARGMTIDLGFATCLLPNNRRVGIVDVPGHERFIHNMVAGASGIDVVLLVVAADDGIMPQTLEHFHIVRLLGVKAGLVAVTKSDLVPPERVREVAEAVRQLVAGSFLDGCPVCPVSSRTGEGFDRFYDAFVATVDRTAQHNASGPFRLHVERSFVLRGLGVIVSGIPRSGAVRVGDSLDLIPGGRVLKVSGVQVYGDDAEAGRAGECVALRLSDLGADEAQRGMVLAAPGYFAPVRFLNARFSVVPELGRPLKPRTAVRVHIGTADVPGYLVLPALSPLAPGSDAYVQLQLRDPAVAAPGDVFVVRQLTPVRTLGGGTVVSPDSVRMRRSRGTWETACRERDEAFRSPEAAVGFALAHADAAPLALAELARRAFLSEDAAREQAAALAGRGEAIELPGGHYAHASALTRAREEIVRVLDGLHDAQPLSLGFPKKDLVRELAADRLLVERALADLLADGEVAMNPTGFHIPSRLPQLSARQTAVAGRIAELYRKEGLGSPRQDELPARLGTPAPLLDPIVRHLLQGGTLVEISDKVLLHRDVVQDAWRKLDAFLAAHGSIEPGAFRDQLGTSRKYVIPLLEYWDAQGLTRRVGNARVRREKKAHTS